MNNVNLNLPTDEEFLDSFFEISKNYYNPTDDPDFLKEVAFTLEKNRMVPSGENPEDFAKKIYEPRAIFRGFKIQTLIEEARKTLPKEFDFLLKTPTGLLFINDLNGFAAPTPRGAAVIVLNLGIIRHMHFLARCMLTLTSWGSPKPFCSDHEPQDYFYAIICLARFACTGNFNHIRGLKVWNCPSLDPLDLKSAKTATIAELFVLLHEYGHVACNHLNSSLLEKKFGLTIYSQSHKQEYEADEFAFKHLMNKHGKDGASIIATLLFRFFDLIEHLQNGKSTASKTHPSGKDRLETLKTTFNLSDPGKQLFGRVESMFDLAVDTRTGATNKTSDVFL